MATAVRWIAGGGSTIGRLQQRLSRAWRVAAPMAECLVSPRRRRYMFFTCSGEVDCHLHVGPACQMWQNQPQNRPGGKLDGFAKVRG